MCTIGLPAANSLTVANRCRSSPIGKNAPVGERFCLNGRFLAPGTWPATGSIGSVSPRYRSGSRASTSSTSPLSSDEIRLAVEIHWVWSIWGSNSVGVGTTTSLVVGWPLFTHAFQPLSSTATSVSPTHRASHQNLAAKAPPELSYATTWRGMDAPVGQLPGELAGIGQGVTAGCFGNRRREVLVQIRVDRPRNMFRGVLRSSGCGIGERESAVDYGHATFVDQVRQFVNGHEGTVRHAADCTGLAARFLSNSDQPARTKKRCAEHAGAPLEESVNLAGCYLQGHPTRYKYAHRAEQH